MIDLTIPGRGDLALRHVVFDVNGTLALDGVLLEGIAGRIAALREVVEVHLLTADTHGGQAAIDAVLGLEASRVQRGQEREQKAAFVERLGAEQVVAMGNGSNDAGMLRVAGIGIAVLGGEGLSIEALNAADVVAASPLGALDLLLKPARLVATLRR